MKRKKKVNGLQSIEIDRSWVKIATSNEKILEFAFQNSEDTSLNPNKRFNTLSQIVFNQSFNDRFL